MRRNKNHSPIPNKLDNVEPRKSASLFVNVKGNTLALNENSGETLDSLELPTNNYARALTVSNAIKKWSAEHNSVVKLGM